MEGEEEEGKRMRRRTRRSRRRRWRRRRREAKENVGRTVDRPWPCHLHALHSIEAEARSRRAVNYHIRAGVLC